MNTDDVNVMRVKEDPRSRLAGVLIPSGLALLLGVFWFAHHNPIMGFTPGTDDSVYLYIGQQMLKGAAPYRDVFDNKGPLLYSLNALGLVLGAGSFWGVYVLEYCLLAVSTVLTYLLLKVRIGWLVAALPRPRPHRALEPRPHACGGVGQSGLLLMNREGCVATSSGLSTA